MHADPFSAKKCARVLNELGTRNPVRILRGGYIEFSRKYPFLRVGGKICYSARQLESFFKVCTTVNFLISRTQRMICGIIYAA